MVALTVDGSQRKILCNRIEELALPVHHIVSFSLEDKETSYIGYFRRKLYFIHMGYMAST